jgi:DNA-directed RNA polymerase specialized sigma24 family protein
MSTSDLEWLTQVVVQRAAGLRLFAQQWVDAATADDVVQEAFVSLLAEHTAPQNPVAWMYRAVRNAAFDQHRSPARRRPREKVVAEARCTSFELRTDAVLDARAAELALKMLTMKVGSSS